ncbi:MAG: hypothetical protein A2V70_01940 [Planctomycetes bacterium RBG_13_63_9]|nr:MAG: hypothetical protein A2V70_01940 [Planctomycetes bacterium RBG_13_63_9]
MNDDGSMSDDCPMNDDYLESLLRDAGRRFAQPSQPRAELADRVRRLHRQRLRRRNVAGGSLVVILLIVGVTSAFFLPGGSTPLTKVPVARRPEPSPAVGRLSAEEVGRLRAEMAQLAAEAERRHQAVRRMIREQHLRRQIALVQRSSVGPNPEELAQISLEKTAFIVLDYAERRSGDAGGTEGDQRETEYRRIVECFPNTKAAETAKMKLHELSIEKGDL